MIMIKNNNIKFEILLLVLIYNLVITFSVNLVLKQSGYYYGLVWFYNTQFKTALFISFQ